MFPLEGKGRGNGASPFETPLKETAAVLTSPGELWFVLWNLSSSHLGPLSFVSGRARQCGKSQHDAKCSQERSSFEVRAFRLLQVG